MPYREDTEGHELRVAALEQENHALTVELERLRATLRSVVAAFAGLPAESEVPWRSLPDGEPLTVTFINRTGAQVTLAWLGYNGRPHEEATVIDEGRRSVEAHTGELWRATDPDGRVVFQRYLRASDAEIELAASA